MHPHGWIIVAVSYAFFIAGHIHIMRGLRQIKDDLDGVVADLGGRAGRFDELISDIRKLRRDFRDDIRLLRDDPLDGSRDLRG